MSGASKDDPIIRPTVRAILLANDRLLLFRARMADESSGRPFWFAPGGGVEAGETHEEALVRELEEETGLPSEIGPEVWRRSHTFLLDGIWMAAEERYFVVHTAQAIEPSRAGWTPLEVEFLEEARWWRHEEIAGSTDIFVPRRLGELLPAILAGDYPAIVIDAGV